MIGMYPRKHKIQAKTPTVYDHRVIQGSICMIGMYSRKNNRLNLKKVTNVLIPFVYVENVMMEDGDDIASPRVKLEPSHWKRYVC